MARQSDPLTLPAGHQAVYLPDTPSTNAHALALAHGGAVSPLWVWAGRQTKGRGRLGRDWDSPEGNLYASLLLRLDCRGEAIKGLPLLGGIAARDAVAAMAGELPLTARLKLKWPNDILLDGAKLGGVLIETLMMDAGAQAVVIGTGLNLASAPEALGRPATCLAEHGLQPTPGAALSRLADATARWLAVWSGGAGFAQVRSAWLRHAAPVGAPISVTLSGETLEGRFGGLDETGALRLRQDDRERIITAGDIALGRLEQASHAKATDHE